MEALLPEANWAGPLSPNDFAQGDEVLSPLKVHGLVSERAVDEAGDEVLSPLKVHGLVSGRAVDVPLSSLPGSSVAELRAHLSSICPISKTPLPLLIVQNGRQLEDYDSVREAKINSRRRFPVFAFVRSRSRLADLCDFCEVRVGKTVLRFQAQSRIDEVKERLFEEGLVLLPPSVQQLILAGRVCHDSTLLGDHLLFLPPSHRLRRGPPQLMVMSTSPSPAVHAAVPAAVPDETAALLQSQRRRASKGSAQRQRRSCTARFKGLQLHQTSLTRPPLTEIMRLYVMRPATTRSPPATPV